MNGLSVCGVTSEEYAIIMSSNGCSGNVESCG
jgi:hypothetical protein